MDQDFAGSVAVVTGAGSGIGEACAVLLAQRGASVLVCDIDTAGAQRVAASIGDRASVFVGDVARPEDCEAMVAAALERYGHLDVAVNNAGIGAEPSPVGELSLEGWRRTVSINLDGVFYCMRYEIPAMAAAGSGAIVNMSSILGSVGFTKAAAYVAAKHGVVGLTRAAAVEYAAQGIRVNAVGPGFIDTPLLSSAPQEVIAGIAALHPLGRLGTSQEVAEVVAFLASSRASNVTGSYYTVDGGYTAR